LEGSTEVTSDEAFSKLECLRMLDPDKVPPGDSFDLIAGARLTGNLAKVDCVEDLLFTVRAGQVCVRHKIFSQEQLQGEIRQMLLESIFDTP
jgi:hypothetical protein